MPAPAEAEVVTVEVVGAGAVTVKPVGNVQVASGNPQIALGAGGAALTVSVSLAWFPVSSVPMNRFVEVLLYVPVTGTVTFTLIVQVPFAATVPFENDSEAAPAAGVKVGVPQPDGEAFAGLATTIVPGVVGSVSVKFSPVSVVGVGLVMVKVNVETPLTFVGSGLKFFVRVTTEGSRTYAKRVETP